MALSPKATHKCSCENNNGHLNFYQAENYVGKRFTLYSCFIMFISLSKEDNMYQCILQDHQKLH